MDTLLGILVSGVDPSWPSCLNTERCYPSG